MTIGTIYLIRSLLIDGHKIGITQNWTRRSRELEVGTKAAEVLVETVPLPKALELALHRRFRKERIPQTEYFALSATQIEEVKALITQEAAKLKGAQADLHVTLARLVYEQESLPAAQVSSHAVQIDRLKRQLDPEYRRQAEQAEAFAQRQRAAREEQRQRQIAAQQARIEEAKAQKRELEEKRLAYANKVVAMPLADAFKEKSIEFGIGLGMTTFFAASFICIVSLFARTGTDCRYAYRPVDPDRCQSADAIGSSALPIGLVIGLWMATTTVNGMIRREKKEAQELLDRQAIANTVSSPLNASQQRAASTPMPQGSVDLGGLQGTPITFSR